MGGRLIVSVSGIRADTRRDVELFAAELDRRSVPLSLLVSPRLKDQYRLLDDPQTHTWLRTRRERGDAIVLHGYDQSASRMRRAEFAVLAKYEAKLRLTAADFMLKQAGLRTRLFAAPRWQASPGAIEALPEVGFRTVAQLTGVVDLVRGEVDRGTVYGIGGGFRTEPWWCRTMVLRAGRVARKDGLLRLAITAKQLSRPGPRQAMLDAIDLALLLDSTPEVYRSSVVGDADAA